MTAKLLETAMSKAVTLPETVQEQLGRELLERIEAHERLRAEIQLGIDQLDAGQGEALDIDSVIKEVRAEYAGR